MHRARSFALLIVTNIAVAAPAPTVTTIDVDLIGINRWSLWHNLQQTDVEPGGLMVPADPDHKWDKLGLKPGDVIRTENGSPSSDRLFLIEGELLLEVDRGGKQILLRLLLHGATRHQQKLTDDEFADVVERTKRSAQGEPLAVPLRAAGKPSGVRIVDDMLFIRLQLHVGDIVRTIDGRPIHSNAEFVAALQGLRVGITEVEVDRLGRRVTLAIVRGAELDLSRIVRRSDTAVELPVAVRDGLKDDFMMFTRKARLVPASANGKIHGVKLFDIAPGSLYDALGLRNDDTVLDVDGRSIDSFDDAIATHTALETATTITVHVVRRGKPLAIVYTVR
jgi:S1-C subfamily serine protease